MTTIPAPAPCPYCAAAVPAEYDGETGRWYTPLHWECVSESRTGEWIVVTWNTEHPARGEHIRRYTTRTRAREVAAEVRRNNPREWRCGEHLEIRVRRSPVIYTTRSQALRAVFGADND